MAKQIYAKAEVMAKLAMTRIRSLNKLEKRLIQQCLLIWIFFHLTLWRGLNITWRDPVEFLSMYPMIVLMPTVLLSFVFAAWTYKHNPSLLAAAYRKQLQLQKGRESLKKRLDRELNWKFIRNLEDRLLISYMMPLAYHVEKLLPNSPWVWEWVLAVRRRYVMAEAAQIISYPRKANGYFFRIYEYLWNKTQATFLLKPRIELEEAKKIIVRRLTKRYRKPVKQIRFYAEAEKLYVSLPHSWIYREE